VHYRLFVPKQLSDGIADGVLVGFRGPTCAAQSADAQPIARQGPHVGARAAGIRQMQDGTGVQ
ncbi:MAG TPA: hypothetical protein VF446_11915, partial [Trinickia sp.]